MRDRETGEMVGRGGLQWTTYVRDLDEVEVGWSVMPRALARGARHGARTRVGRGRVGSLESRPGRGVHASGQRRLAPRDGEGRVRLRPRHPPRRGTARAVPRRRAADTLSWQSMFLLTRSRRPGRIKLQAATVVLDHDDMRRTLVRIAHEIIEKNPDGAIALVGIHRRGAVLAQRLHALTGELLDTRRSARLRRHLLLPRRPHDPAERADRARRPSSDFPVDGRTIVVVDDVLYTGRTVRAAVDEVFDYGRPARVQLAVLVDRGHRELPIRPTTSSKNLRPLPSTGQRPRQGDRR